MKEVESVYYSSRLKGIIKVYHQHEMRFFDSCRCVINHKKVRVNSSLKICIHNMKCTYIKIKQDVYRV